MQETVDGEKSRGGYGSSHPSVSTVVARAVGEKEGFPPKDYMGFTSQDKGMQIKVCRVGIQWLVSLWQNILFLMFQRDCMTCSHSLQSTQPVRWRYTSTPSHCHMWKSPSQPGPYLPPCLFKELIHFAQLYLTTNRQTLLCNWPGTLIFHRVFLQLYCANASPGDLVKTQILTQQIQSAV